MWAESNENETILLILSSDNYIFTIFSPELTSFSPLPFSPLLFSLSPSFFSFLPPSLFLSLWLSHSLALWLSFSLSLTAMHITVLHMEMRDPVTKASQNKVTDNLAF